VGICRLLCCPPPPPPRAVATFPPLPLFAGTSPFPSLKVRVVCVGLWRCHRAYVQCYSLSPNMRNSVFAATSCPIVPFTGCLVLSTIRWSRYPCSCLFQMRLFPTGLLIRVLFVPRAGPFLLLGCWNAPSLHQGFISFLSCVFFDLSFPRLEKPPWAESFLGLVFRTWVPSPVLQRGLPGGNPLGRALILLSFLSQKFTFSPPHFPRPARYQLVKRVLVLTPVHFPAPFPGIDMCIQMGFF